MAKQFRIIEGEVYCRWVAGVKHPGYWIFFGNNLVCKAYFSSEGKDAGEEDETYFVINNQNNKVMKKGFAHEDYIISEGDINDVIKYYTGKVK